MSPGQALKGQKVCNGTIFKKTTWRCYDIVGVWPNWYFQGEPGMIGPPGPPGQDGRKVKTFKVNGSYVWVRFLSLAT